MKAASTDPQVRLRMPQDLKDWVAKKAYESGRSLNAEIVFRLAEDKKREAEPASAPGKASNRGSRNERKEK